VNHRSETASALFNRFCHQVPAFKLQEIERVVHDSIGPRPRAVLQGLEARHPVVIDRDDFAVENGRGRPDATGRRGDRGKIACEVFVPPQDQSDALGILERKDTVTIEHDLVGPLSPAWQLSN
jgi:hypothetical protein